MKQQRINKYGHQQGFTLVEIFITMAIVALLLVLGVPSYREAVLNSNLRSAAIDLVTALNAAHAQAVGLRNTIEVKATDGADWSNGWLLDYPAALAQETDQTFPAYPNVTVTPASGDMSLSFNNRGMVTVPTSFDVCDSRPDEVGRRVTISITGRVSTVELFPCP